MVVKVETLKAMDAFSDMDDAELKVKLQAIETLIRAYTNNNFQNRAMRIEAESVDGHIVGTSPFFKVGDTLQISQSLVNDGLFVITRIANGMTCVDGDLFDYPLNTVTKVQYPVDIQKGVIDLMLWEKENRSKVGVKSETLSRHSVTYYDQDANNSKMGYPVALLGFLKPYIKARF